MCIIYTQYLLRERDLLRQHLLAKGIKTEIHYPIPPFRQKAFEGKWLGDYPESEKLAKTEISLPISYAHTKEDIMFVIEIINGWLA